MLNFGPPQIILIAFFLLVGFPVHEFAHAYAAWRLGDSTAKHFGRLTLNPVVHFDPIGGLLLVISVLAGTGFIVGWAKPTPINPSNLRDRRNGEVIVSLAGPASNLLMAAVGAIAFRALLANVTLTSQLDQVLQLLFTFVVYSVALMVINLVPVPPLDGSALLYRLVSPATAWRLRPVLAQYGLLLIVVIVLFGGQVIGRLIYDAASFLVGI